LREAILAIVDFHNFAVLLRHFPKAILLPRVYTGMNRDGAHA
jgi:hypothetical protein